MEKEINCVEEFHKKFNVDIGDRKNPSLVDEETYNLRYKLIKEELNEYLDACKNNDLVEVADAIGDMLYLVFGTVVAHGMQDKIIEVFNEIQSSNMSKLGEDGKPIFREDGKILKGPNYFRPNLKQFFEK